MSILGNEEVVALIKSKFIPLAVAIGAHGHAEDQEGELYRKIVAHRSTESFQGFYVFDAACHVQAHEGGSRHDPLAVRDMLLETARNYRPVEVRLQDTPAERDLRAFPRPPEGGLIIDVTSKMLEGFADAPLLTPRSSVDTLGKGQFKLAVFNESLGRDRLWIRAEEASALKQGQLPESLKRRIALFHLVDNTRCFPEFWEPADLRELQMTLDENGRLTGTVHLETKSGDRGFVAEIYGRVAADEESVSRFDVVAKGHFWGGKIKGGHRPPEGKFPLAIGFTLSSQTAPFAKLPPAGVGRDDYWK